MSEVQISKTLLILKSNANSTQSAEAFLRNREWNVISTTSLKDFLTYIIQKKPSFVMISVDHPNKKVSVMPKILTQSFPLCVFTFAENSSSVSFRKLQDVLCPYKINPPATGPAIERTVNKFLKDQEKKLRDQNEKPHGEHTQRSDTSESKVNIVQQGAGNGGSHSTEVGGWNQAASIFSQLLEGDDAVKNDKQAADNGDVNSDHAGVIVSKGNKASSGSGSWVPSENGDGSKSGILSGTSGGGVAGHISGEGSQANGSTQSNSSGLSSDGSNSHLDSGSGTSGILKSKRGGSAGPDSKNNGSDSNGINDEGGGNSAGTLNGPKKRNSGSESGSMTYNDEDFDESDQARKLARNPNSIQVGKDKAKKESAGAGEGEDTPVGNLRAPKRYEKDQKVHTVMGKNTRETMESIILKGTKQALDETVEILDGEVSQELEDSSHVACIVVESARFNGYLIAALGKNRKMDGKFIKAIQDKLFKFLKDNGENITDKDNMNLKIKKVEFEDWAVEYADFLKKSVHNGEEIAMAFFPVTNVRAEVGESAAATMASVKLTELEGDKTVEFNMYVYLPSNKKYILYTPKGGKFYGNQKDRLVEKGVQEVHMLKSEVNDLSKYKAQNYLNNLIDGYKKKKGGAAAA